MEKCTYLLVLTRTEKENIVLTIFVLCDIQKHRQNINYSLRNYFKSNTHVSISHVIDNIIRTPESLGKPF